MALQTKSVSSKILKRKDGLRILATRSPGMYVEKSNYDVWMPNLGPSETLLHELWNDKVTWAGFLRAYRKELLADPTQRQGNKRHKNHGQMYTLKLVKRLAEQGNVTLLCHCDEEEELCHRHELRRLILSNRI
jgi:uncharacterized protein YeaO (DUF488 family)